MPATAFLWRLSGTQSLNQLALVAFTGTLQFLPGIIATPYWAKANRKGLLAGLRGGLLVWLFAMLLPMTLDYQLPLMRTLMDQVTGAGDNSWAHAVMASLALNAGLFIAVSLLTRTSSAEKVAAEICSMDDRARPIRQILSLHSAEEFSEQLAPALGEKTARMEVQRALDELQFSPAGSSPLCPAAPARAY